MPRLRLVVVTDDETMMSHAEAHIQRAFITLMTRRLARPRRQPEAAPTILATAA